MRGGFVLSCVRCMNVVSDACMYVCVCVCVCVNMHVCVPTPLRFFPPTPSPTPPSQRLTHSM